MVLYDGLCVVHGWVHAYYIRGADMVAATANLLPLFLILSIPRAVVADSDYQMIKKLVLRLISGVFCHLVAPDCCCS